MGFVNVESWKWVGEHSIYKRGDFVIKRFPNKCVVYMELAERCIYLGESCFATADELLSVLEKVSVFVGLQDKEDNENEETENGLPEKGTVYAYQK